MNRKEWIDYINKQLDNRAELLRKIHDELLGLERIENFKWHCKSKLF